MRIKKTWAGVLTGVALAMIISGCTDRGTTGAAGAKPLSVLVVDQQAVLQSSLAGQDIARQTQVLRDQIGAEVEAERQQIISAEDTLQRTAGSMSPAQRQAKIKELEDRKRAYPTFEQNKVKVLQLSVARASDQVGSALRPLLQQIIDERKATVLLDRQAVMFADPSLDITEEATKRLNDQIKQVKVERVDQVAPAAPPPQPTNTEQPPTPTNP